MNKLNKFAFLIVMASFALFSCQKKEDPDPVNDPDPILGGTALFTGASPMGVCYGPYHIGDFKVTPFPQAPGKHVPASQIDTDLGMIAQHFTFFRTYTQSDGMDTVPYFAKKHNLQVALGVWVWPNDATKTTLEANTAVRLAKQYPDQVRCITVSNEPSANGVTFARVVEVMNEVHAMMKTAGISKPLSSCIKGPEVKNAQVVLDACKNLNDAGSRHIFLTIYPYGGQRFNPTPYNTPGDIKANMDYSYGNAIKPCEDAGLNVIIGEMGWPSGIDNNETPAPASDKPLDWETVAHTTANYFASLSWIRGNHQGSTVFPDKIYTTFWFEMFDEPWKMGEDSRGTGPCYGIYYNNPNPGMKFDPSN
ncbi:MAG: hypothetical protein IH596_05935 [Bacteroidales bacterium]|nr:hypothetical protein [Bacteroidales bacterium]